MTAWRPGRRAVPPEPITLSALEFDVLWEHLRLDAMPLVLKVPSPGRTHTERSRLVRAVWDGLAARGLARPGSLNADLAELLRLLDRPEREVDGRLWLGQSVRVLAAATGGAGVLAVLRDERLCLRAASADGLPREALSVLPPRAAGQGQSVTLPGADLDAAAAEAATADGLPAALRARGVRAEDAWALASMITDAGHTGQFGAAARDRWGRRRRIGRVVAFFDTPRGRYLQLRRDSPDGQAWSTISPADPRLLCRLLQELHAEAEDSAVEAARPV